MCCGLIIVRLIIALIPVVSVLGDATSCSACYLATSATYQDGHYVHRNPICVYPCLLNAFDNGLAFGAPGYVRYAGCACPTSGGGGDPHFGGFRGQFLTFNGEDNRWYSVLQGKRIAVHMRTAAVSGGGSARFISALGVTVSNLAESSKVTTIGIFNNQDDALSHLPNGEIQFELNGEAMDPGHHVGAAAGLTLLFAHTTPACQYRTKDAIQRFNSNAMQLRIAARSLTSVQASRPADPDAIAMAPGALLMAGPVDSPDKCQHWIAARHGAYGSGDIDSVPSLYTAGGTKASTIILTLPGILIRIEHMNTIGGDVRLDFHLIKYEPPADASGILGQTAKLRYDASGSPIYKGSVLQGYERDYEVSGPFSGSV